MDYINYCEKHPQTYVISNVDFEGNFIENRNGEYNAGSFLELKDWKRIEKWNTKVNPCDTVIHCGQFGSNWPIKYLTGNLKISNSLESNELKR